MPFPGTKKRPGGGGGGSGPPLEFAKLNIADITANEIISLILFIFVHFHSYTSNRINPQNNNQITSIQVCVMGYFLLKVGPPLEKFSGSAPVMHQFEYNTNWFYIYIHMYIHAYIFT